jgi:HlyD family secretion protein
MSEIFKTIRKYFVPLLALFGFISAVRAVLAGNQTPPVAIPIAAPPKAPFDHFVAGAGLIEASSENISIAPEVSGVVETIFVKVGQSVLAGEPLFAIDSRSQVARVSTAEAQVSVATAQLSEAKALMGLINKVKDMRAVSEELLVQRTSRVETATAELARAKATLAQERVELERLTIRSPIDATVLQIRAKVGEFAAAAKGSGDPLMIVGSTKPLHARIDVDENDSWRMEPGAKAVAFLRSNSEVKLPLEFVRFEPFIIPKRSLTGESTERVDTRVFQAIYRIVGENPSIFVGQLLDVYIETKPNL